MKIILKESQIETVAEKFKPILFKYWKLNGPSLSRQLFKMIGINSLHSNKLKPYFYEFLIEWFGGDEKFIEYLTKNEGETYHIVDGGYNFEIILDEIILIEYHVYLRVKVKPGGTVTLIFDENQPTLSLNDALSNDDYGGEISSEIKDTIFDNFFKFFSEFGFTIEGIDIDYM